jgi:hypothetical protein
VNAKGGVDAGFAGGVACAAIVVLRYADLTMLSTVTAIGSLTFPYISGLLHHCQERFVRPSPELQQAGEKAALAQLRYLQINLANLGFPCSWALAVAVIAALRHALMLFCTNFLFRFRLDQHLCQHLDALL